MAVASLSVENQIIQGLAALNCAEANFVKLVNGVVGKSRIFEALREPTKPFSGQIADRLLEKLSQMEDLQAVVFPIPVDWSRVELVSNAMLIRMTAQAALDLGIESQELQTASEWATRRVQESEVAGGLK